MGKLIAILEDNADRVAVMRRWLADRLGMYEHFVTDDPDTLIEYIRPRLDDVLAVSLDHDLHERPDGNTEVTGMAVVDYLTATRPGFPVLIHSSNSRAVGEMRERLRSKDWVVVAVTPFDDTNWIGDDWYPALKRTLRRFTQPEPVAAPDGDGSD